MLRKMCVLPVSLQPASHDIVLISLFHTDIIDNNKLNNISKGDHTRPILIKQSNEFIFCKFDFYKNQWNRYKLPKLPFHHIQFPEQFNFPEFKERDGYDLVLMSSLPEQNKKMARINTIYLSDDGRYVVLDPEGIVQEGQINTRVIDINNLEERITHPELQFAILQTTSKARHTRNNFNYSSDDYWPWNHYHYEGINDENYYMQEPMFHSMSKFEKLLQLHTYSKLGAEFTLARGASAICFSVSNPIGHSGYLKHKAADDFKGFQKLLKKGY